MKSKKISLICVGAFAIAAQAGGNPIGAADNYGKLPPSFEANRGQTNPRVKFLSRGSGYTVFLTSNEAILLLRKGKSTGASAALHMKLLGSNSSSELVGLHELTGKTNYFVGNDPSKWRTNIPSYAKVRCHNVYPNIDLLYHASRQQLEFDFLVAPFADVTALELSFDGAAAIRVDSSGDLVLSTAQGELRFNRPHLYQPDDRSSPPVKGKTRSLPNAQYVLTGANRVRFRLPSYDTARALVIDPVLSYSTFLGGSSDNFGNAIAVDKLGHAYVTGATTSVDFPTTPGAFETTYQGDDGSGYQGVIGDVFVTKFNRNGSGVVYSTYIGGSAGDSAYGIALDIKGNAYLTGATNSSNFPVTPGVYQPICCGLNDVFVTKLGPSGSKLIYSTHFGVSGQGIRGFSIAVSANGSVFVTGNAGPGFPTTPGAFQTVCNGSTNGFIFKLNPKATAAEYSTCLGGSSVDYGESIAIDSAGRAYVTGLSSSADFPTTAGAFQKSNKGGTDGFVTVFNPTGTKLVYSTLLGGSSNDQGFTIAVDSAGKAYLTGVTSSSDFPITPGSFQTKYGGGNSDAFVAKIDRTKSGSASLIYSTFLGGSGDENQRDFLRDILAVDSGGNVYVTGNTNSTDFPTKHPIQATSGGGFDAYVSKLNASGSRLVYSTYLGGSSDDYGRGIALAGEDAFITGQTYSPDFPISKNAFQTVFQGSADAFVARIKPSPSALGHVETNNQAEPRKTRIRKPFDRMTAP
jgi:Beta-propeller repeat